MTDPITEEFHSLVGRQLTIDFVKRLTEATNKDAAFSTAACVDAVLAFEALLKSQTNANEYDVETACSLFAVSIYNSLSDYKCSVIYEKEN